MFCEEDKNVAYCGHVHDWRREKNSWKECTGKFYYREVKLMWYLGKEYGSGAKSA